MIPRPLVSQRHKVQDHIEGDRVAGVSYALCGVPSLLFATAVPGSRQIGTLTFIDTGLINGNSQMKLNSPWADNAPVVKFIIVISDY